MVQSTGVNALIALVGSLPSSPPSANAGDDGEIGQQFSQLLSDSGKQFDEQASGQPYVKSSFTGSATLGAISAQEITGASNDQLTQLMQAREQLITSEDARDLMQRVDKILAQDRAPASTRTLTQIKDQLQRILRGGEPKTIGEILQAVPEVKESKLSLLGLTALLTPRKADAAANKPEEEEESSLLASSQLVPTTIFRPDPAVDGTEKAAPGESQTKTSESLGTINVLVPLSAMTVSPLPLPTLNGNSSRVRADLDTMIPPLTLSKEEPEALPQVNLPQWTAESAPSKSVHAGLFESLASTAAHNGGLMKDEIAALSSDKSADVLPAINNPSHAGGFSQTQMVSAAQPINIIPTHGYINHAPVSEQVNVAVRKAAKDGIGQITVQLDPVELGRVEVNIQTNRDGLTQISFLVDKPDTFDNLSRDARTLERALQESGVKTDTGSMQFNLRQQSQPQLHSDLGNSQGNRQHYSGGDEDTAAHHSTTAAIDAVTRNYIFNVRDGVDISA